MEMDEDNPKGQGHRVLRVLPQESSSFYLQHCAQLPESILQIVNPYSTGLEEYISLCVTRNESGRANDVKLRTNILLRISAFETNSGATADESSITCDIRVQEIHLENSADLSRFPQLNEVDILVACSIRDMLCNYWDRHRNICVKMPLISDHSNSDDFTVRKLKCSTIRTMSVTVIFEDLSHNQNQQNMDCSGDFSKQLLKDAFKAYGVHVKGNTVIDFRECPFLSAFQWKVNFVFVHDCLMSNSQADIGRVNSQTQIAIRRNHDLPYFRRILDAVSTVTDVSFPGLQPAYSELKSCFEIHLPSITKQLSKKHYYSGVLLGGPSGSGKRNLVLQVAKIYCARVFSCNLGVEEKKIRQSPKTVIEKLTKIYEDASYSSAVCGYPVLILLENLEILQADDAALTSRTRDNKEAITNHICDLLDVAGTDVRLNVPFVVVATTSKPYLIPEKLRICSRLSQEKFINVPDLAQRVEILKSMQAENSELSSLNIEFLARRTPGYVRSDLIRLINLALLKSHETNDCQSFEKHLKFALSRVLPSVLQGGIGVISSKVSEGLEHISGLDAVKMELVQTIVWPLVIPEALERMGIQPQKGIILYGPSGCGKTSLVRAIASSHHTNFISVSSAELFSSGVGDSEKIISHLFHLARQASPCVLFVDELDAIVGSRDSKSSGGKGVNDMILSMLLTEMDGIGQRNSFAVQGHDTKLPAFGQRFVVVGATNRPDMIDSALLRPGRFDRLVPVPPPNETDRLKLLKNCTRNTALGNDVILESIANRTERFSGADIVNLCREAGLRALSENIDATCVSMKHYEDALTRCSPSISNQYLDSFYKYSSREAASTLHIELNSLNIN